ncbi:unnamed protein product [Clavelina lepadiformis]|uniref:Fibronectin type-III domain-containing protein n=1 Tax=Clavelina lepadiformis TaxID=159417 RepID=A0ABP0FY16_CLALP
MILFIYDRQPFSTKCQFCFLQTGFVKVFYNFLKSFTETRGLWKTMLLQLIVIYFWFTTLTNAQVSTPNDFKKDSIRSTFFIMGWTADPNARYELYVEKKNSGLDLPSEPGEGVTATPGDKITQVSSGDDIVPDTTYDYVLFTVNSKNLTQYETSSPDGVTTAPAAPTISGITAVGSDRFTVNWDYTNPTSADFQQASEYRVTYSDGGVASQTKPVANIDTKMLQITGLTSNTDYSVTVVAWKSDVISTDDSASSPVATFNRPTGLSATTVTSTSIEISWSALHTTGGGSASIAGYVVSWTPASSGGSSTEDVTDTSATIDNLQANTDYSITVAAKSTNGGAGTLSDALPATTVFGKPTDVTVTERTSSNIRLSWNEPGTGGCATTITGYKISCTPPHGTTTTGDEASAEISGLNSNTDYNITVAAQSLTGDGDESDLVNGTTVPLQVNQPSNSLDATTSKIYLKWDAVNGTSPSLTYTVNWTPSGTSGSRTDLTTTSANISSLTASTRYTFTVTAVNDGGSADPSDPAMFSTLPNRTDFTNLTRPSTNSTTQIYVEWNKPSGGDDIVDYVVDWWLSSSDGSMTSSGIVTGATTSSYTIEGLTPGETYGVTVKARNSAGAGQPSSSVKHVTNPDSVKNISLTQNSNLPDKELDLTWDKPNGTGDNILIESNSTTSNVTNSTSVEFNISQASLSVVPGNNYTVAVIVYSKEVASKEVHVIANSKPSEPSFDVEASTNELLVTWTAPDGYFDGLTILLDGNNVTEVEDGNPQIIDGLDPYTDFKVEMYSWITNVKGEMERSRTSPRTCKTLPGPPPLSNPDSSLTENAESSTSTIRFVLPPNTFSEKNGPIEYYAVYLAFGVYYWRWFSYSITME